MGVYCTNQGYADFRPIDILIEKDDYSIIANDTNQGVSRYDFIVLDGTTIKENQIIYYLFLSRVDLLFINGSRKMCGLGL